MNEATVTITKSTSVFPQTSVKISNLEELDIYYYNDTLFSTEFQEGEVYPLSYFSSTDVKK